MERFSLRSQQDRHRGRSQLLMQVLDRGEHRCAIITVHIAGQQPKQLHRALSERGFNTTLTLHAYAVLDFADKGVDWAIRLSPHYYNTLEEVDAFVDALHELGSA